MPRRAVKAASIANQPALVAYFAYERGVAMPELVAPARRVAPNSASFACFSYSSSRARRKNSVSLGLAPGQPPSM